MNKKEGDGKRERKKEGKRDRVEESKRVFLCHIPFVD